MNTSGHFRPEAQRQSAALERKLDKYTPPTGVTMKRRYRKEIK
jgi:hypothetical protein